MSKQLVFACPFEAFDGISFEKLETGIEIKISNFNDDVGKEVTLTAHLTPERAALLKSFI